MKILKKVINLVILLLILTSCNKNIIKQDNEIKKDDEIKTSSTPLFYKITKDNTDTTIYLLGSIHAADDSAYPFTDTIINAFSNSDYLAVEVDIKTYSNDLNAQLALTKKLMYDDGTTIKNHLDNELYQSMVELLKEKKSYNSLYDNYKPIFFESLFENIIIQDAGLDSDKGIDSYFLDLAFENEKEILEIESVNFQYNLLLSFSDELEIILIENYVEKYDDNVIQMQELYEAWKRGNLAELNSLLFTEDYEDLTEEQIKLINEYNNALIIDRNYNMANTLDKYYRNEKNVFCVVGLGHVIGDEGITSLMRKKGYKIEQIN